MPIETSTISGLKGERMSVSLGFGVVAGGGMVGVKVGVAVGVNVDVEVGVGVSVAVEVAVAVGVGVLVAVAEGVGLATQTIISAGTSITEGEAASDVVIHVLASAKAKPGPHPVRVSYTAPGRPPVVREVSVEVLVPIEVRPRAESIALAPGDSAELIYHEYCLAEASDLGPDPAEYLLRFPEHAEALGRLFALHGALPASMLRSWVEPAELPSTGDEIGPYRLARELGRPLSFAQRVAYCLRLTGAARVVGKTGNRLIYSGKPSSGLDQRSE